MIAPSVARQGGSAGTARRLGGQVRGAIAGPAPQSSEEQRSMIYFVTGATGFIGRRLVKKLLSRRG
ncbi:MAG: SDR family oxidoreductase, partial [Burkholderiales bacterium]